MDSSGSRAPKARPAATYKQALDGRSLLLKAVIGSFFSDDHIVHMALAQTGRRDTHKLSTFAQFLNRAAAAIAHPGSQSAYQLIHEVGQQALIRHPPFDTFGNQLPACRSVLRVSIRRAL